MCGNGVEIGTMEMTAKLQRETLGDPLRARAVCNAAAVGSSMQTSVGLYTATPTSRATAATT